MGPHAHFRCLQPGRRRLFHDLLLFVPSLVTEAPKIRRLVSCISPGSHHPGYAFPILPIPFSPHSFKSRAGKSLVISRVWLKPCAHSYLALQCDWLWPTTYICASCQGLLSVCVEIFFTNRFLLDGLLAQSCSYYHGLFSWDRGPTLNI